MTQTKDIVMIYNEVRIDKYPVPWTQINIASSCQSVEDILVEALTWRFEADTAGLSTLRIDSLATMDVSVAKCVTKYVTI